MRRRILRALEHHRRRKGVTDRSDKKSTENHREAYRNNSVKLKVKSPQLRMNRDRGIHWKEIYGGERERSAAHHQSIERMTRGTHLLVESSPSEANPYINRQSHCDESGNRKTMRNAHIQEEVAVTERPRCCESEEKDQT